MWDFGFDVGDVGDVEGKVVMFRVVQRFNVTGVIKDPLPCEEYVIVEDCRRST